MRRFDWRSRPAEWFASDNKAQGHDQWVYFVCRVAGKVALIADHLALYRQHGSNTCGFFGANVRERLRKVTNDREGYYARRTRRARQCQEYLETLAAQHPGLLGERLVAGARQYGEIAGYTAGRAALHAATGSRIQRTYTLFRLWRQGAYRNRDIGGWGLQGFALDASTLVR